ncbi:hypothetical protein B0T20DRAFT_277662 [Sordaria brevicollis]|uniref:Uncharacterized protein n=1 Tax=Sordaria brevicollis TaxID=83679 RepID=A0AAE0PB40_SORBR|nr:hypothetical protein B0T20DRAFT_277662 [Sordaria brevicollis]
MTCTGNTKSQNHDFFLFFFCSVGVLYPTPLTLNFVFSNTGSYGPTESFFKVRRQISTSIQQSAGSSRLENTEGESGMFFVVVGLDVDTWGMEMEMEMEFLFLFLFVIFFLPCLSFFFSYFFSSNLLFFFFVFVMSFSFMS